MEPYQFSVSIHPGQIAAASVLALVAGAVYAWLLNRPRYRWIAEDATEVSVVIGVALTLVASAVLFWSLPIFFGFLWMFSLTGLSQILRSAYNRHDKAASGRNTVKAAAREASNDR
jgi:hypothetical protein